MASLSADEQDAVLAQVFAGRRGGVAAEEPESALPFYEPPKPKAQPVTFEKARREPDPVGFVDIPEWLGPPTFRDGYGELHAITDAEGVIARLVDGVTLERKAIWAYADMAAWLWSELPSKRERARLAGQLVKDVGLTAKTWRRYIAAARTFGPEHRHDTLAFNVYLVAMTTTDPLGAVEVARIENLTAAGLAKRIRKEEVLDHTELLDETLAADCDPEDVAALVFKAVQAAKETKGVRTIRVRVDMESKSEAA